MMLRDDIDALIADPDMAPCALHVRLARRYVDRVLDSRERTRRYRLSNLDKLREKNKLTARKRREQEKAFEAVMGIERRKPGRPRKTVED